MKLISENSYEDHLINGLVALLRDLNVDAIGFRRADAIASTFWSYEDFSLELPFLKELSREELTAMLEDLEPELMKAMVLAGFEVLDNSLRHATGAQVHRHHRQISQ